MEERRLERTVRKNSETAERKAKERRLCCIYQCVNYKERKVREMFDVAYIKQKKKNKTRTK